MNAELSKIRKALTTLFGSAAIILAMLFVGFPERISEPLVIAWILCFSLWATLGCYWAWCVLWLWAVFGGA